LRRVGYAPGVPARLRGVTARSVIVIKTGPHLKQAREALGWTPLDLARALRLAGGDKQGEKRVLEMEAGKRDISGPVTVAVESFLHGYLPVGFKPEGGGGEPPA
jgi:rhamnose utilization protein RhaD (predicted bifunctional aldolase and dehydrogenase)